ncbi:MAG: DUF47 domain-containing protein [Vulcanimicrobiaceae bacterium]
MKTQVLAAIGETDFQPTAQLNAALAANDRIKYYFSLLQSAVSQADRAEPLPPTLRRERIACGVDDQTLDTVVRNARREATGYQVPECAGIVAAIARDVRTMAAPILASVDRQLAYRERIELLLAALPAISDDLIDGRVVAAMTNVWPRDDTSRAVPGSLHELVIDLHKELNTLAGELAEQVLDGARCYGLAEADRPFVAAFMTGVNRTAKLKFGHPGLGTMATHTGERLVIQNDIGTTDAHVIVIHVDGLSVTLTYADVHPERLEFFQEMLARFEVAWESVHASRVATLAAGEPFYLATARFAARDEAECRTYLEWLGSRIVFLIDWNRARKELRSFLRAELRIEVLRWAAEAEVGHRGFLELGGARTINRAIEAAAGSAMHFGDRLCDVLGDEEATTFVKFVLQIASEGILAKQSHALLRDRIRAELQTHFSNEELRLLALAADHAGLIFEIASLVREGLSSAVAGEAANFGKLAKRARGFEHDADQLVIAGREAVRRRPEYGVFQRLLESADDAADELEDVAFLLTLPPGVRRDRAPEGLRVLADLVVGSAQEWVKATHIRVSRAYDDTDDFLTAIDRIAALEQEADDAERALTEEAVEHANDFRQLHVYSRIGYALEEATDVLKHAALMLRDHLLGDVLGA